MNKSDLESLLDNLEHLQDKSSAMNLGIALLTSDLTVEDKKSLFEMAFKMGLNVSDMFFAFDFLIILKLLSTYGL